MTWYTVFWTAPKGGNAWYILAHQYMAAMLNILNDASTTPAVDDAIADAEALFAIYDSQAEIDSLKGKAGNAIRAQFLEAAGILGSFNEGLVGPGHCDEQLPQ